MSAPDLYYTAPSDEVFAEIKQAAVDVWNTFDNTHGYVTEKLALVGAITNVRDNWMTLIALFDLPHQRMMLANLSHETYVQVAAAMRSVGYNIPGS